MNPYVLATLLMSLSLGTTITFASSHWLLAWMGLEINTLAILPIMAQNHHPRATEATTKYFLIQSTAAALLLFASNINAWMTGQWEINYMIHPLPVTLATLALALKIGLAPVHAWLPEVIQGVDLTTGLILSTWQKLPPFTLLLQIYPSNSPLLIILGITSTFIGGWGGMNQTQLRKILAYSSIAHLGWMTLVLQFSPSLSFLSMTLYIIMTFSLFMILKLTNSTTINSLAISWTKTPVLTTITPLILLSLGGLPPLSGFMPKWLILHELTKQGINFIATLAAFSALLSLNFYIRLSYAVALTMAPNNLSGTAHWRSTSNQPTLPILITATATLMLLPLTPTIKTLILT
uniref:NADH-ubiquinone oxidoreductase chain 2 n=1 Tax=Draconetta xenica TaxID=215391 RepID=A0A060NQ24_9TELE|nr:NADH dehydrogenase subunit 2 [Draconetta xenica]BAO84681.1 NADH dehydrogenase subunit 2 [Draconetta xenica]